MPVSVFHYTHPIEGEIRLERRSDEVRLYCRWPFDLSSDEWIYLSNRFSLDDYKAAITRLRTGESVKISGLGAGALSITDAGTRGLELHMTDARRSAPTQFIVCVDAPVDAFDLA